jgi:Uma2 family endonuclease
MRTAQKTIETPQSRRGTPVWELAHLFPTQGHWTEEDYLGLETNLLIEYTDGVLEFLEMPSPKHQLIVQYIQMRLLNFVSKSRRGSVMSAPLPIRIASTTYREPDLVYFAKKLADLSKAPNGADLVMEIVSPGSANRRRDIIKKRREYADAGIAEYWIVDPESSTITVLALNGTKYEQAGKYKAGQTAVSKLLPGFNIDVTEALSAD